MLFLILIYKSKMLLDVTLSPKTQSQQYQALLLHLTCCLIDNTGNGGLLQNLEMRVSRNKTY